MKKKLHSKKNLLLTLSMITVLTTALAVPARAQSTGQVPGLQSGRSACSTASRPITSTISRGISLETTADVSEDTKFDAAILNLTKEDFSREGYSFGDSFDVEFSNGYRLTDVPYYNGYYVKTGEPVIVAYPKNDYVLITNNNRGIWTDAGFQKGDSVEITLNTSGRYRATYEALGQDYSVDRETYDSDEEFANFRALSGGNLKENFLYRGASPVDNSRGRAAYADSLMEKTGIQCIIDLADSQADMASYLASEDFVSSYAKSLYEDRKTALLSMSSNYAADAYKTSLAQGLRLLMENGGPAYIHCMEGKDRTGFVCLLLEALAGASYEEMCADYMTTYANYYHITREETPDRYQAVVTLYFDAFLEYLCDTENPEELMTADYREAARNYLLSSGMTTMEIHDLTDLICQ